MRRGTVKKVVVEARERVSGAAMRLVRGTALGCLIIVAVAGVYGSGSGYSLGYDQGLKDGSATTVSAESKKAFEAGKELGRREASQEGISNVQAQVQQQVQDKLQAANAQINAQLQAAFNQGVSAHARAMLDSHLSVTITPPPPIQTRDLITGQLPTH